MFNLKSVLFTSFIIGALTVTACTSSSQKDYGPLDPKVNPCASVSDVNPCAAIVDPNEVLKDPCASVKKIVENIKEGISYDFVKGEKKVSGSVVIKDNIVTLSEDFSVEAGPDLKIALYEDKNPPLSLDLDKVIILSEEAFTEYSGTMNATIPEVVDINDYSSVVIFCEEYNVNFAYANIR